MVPDVGDADEISVTEILVKVGDELSKDDSIVVLESDKASMEIPSPHEGSVTEILVAEGDEVGQGDPVLKMKVAAAASAEESSGKKEASKDTTAEDEESGEADAKKEKKADTGRIEPGQSADRVQIRERRP
ncbi:MAG: biotin/lipoyl-containing protein [Gammaproteobacteria bacterium]|nr:biotin/lipoyl-containing protein [Gammaproteobacteria bacterium]